MTATTATAATATAASATAASATAAGVRSVFLKFQVKSYSESRAQKGAAPWKRQARLVVHSSPRRWHVLVTFVGLIKCSGDKQKRQEDFKDFCLCIDWKQENIRLIDDLVTELVVKCSEDHNDASSNWYCDDPSSYRRLVMRSKLEANSDLAPFAEHFQIIVREDPRQVRFPLYLGDGITPIRHISEVTEEGRHIHATNKVRLAAADEIYICKMVESSFYVSGDSEVLERELRVLEELRGKTNGGIVHLAGIVISENPYRTIEDDGSEVLRGILLEYHPNGTLKDAITSPELHMTWGRWGHQVARALACLHERDIPHMDLKPENVVISREYNAVLIDVSGIGGYSPEWLAPEMLNKVAEQQSPMLQDTDMQKQNDIWALGRILLAMGNASRNEKEKMILMSVAREAMTVQVPRISLHKAISRLSQAD